MNNRQDMMLHGTGIANTLSQATKPAPALGLEKRHVLG